MWQSSIIRFFKQMSLKVKRTISFRLKSKNIAWQLFRKIVGPVNNELLCNILFSNEHKKVDVFLEQTAADYNSDCFRILGFNDQTRISPAVTVRSLRTCIYSQCNGGR